MRAADQKAPFEVHLTVSLDDARLGELAAFAEEQGYHFIHILLDSGDHPNQPMISWRQGDGLDAALTKAESISTELETKDMRTSRVKVEAELSTASAFEPRYLEAHYKVRVALEQISALRDAADELGVHLSANAHSVDEDGEERFLTARHDDLRSASEFFEQLERQIEAGGWPVVAVHQEAVLFDSNLDLDNGWIS